MADAAREVGILRSTTAHGYGFIRRANDAHGNKQPSLFVHANQCNNMFDTWKAGTRLEFSVGKDRDGRIEAQNVIAV